MNEEGTTAYCAASWNPPWNQRSNRGVTLSTPNAIRRAGGCRRSAADCCAESEKGCRRSYACVCGLPDVVCTTISEGSSNDEVQVMTSRPRNRNDLELMLLPPNRDKYLPALNAWWAQECTCAPTEDAEEDSEVGEGAEAEE